MSDVRLLFMAGHGAEKYADRIASDKKLYAEEKLAAAQAENDRLNRQAVVLTSEATRARSRAGLDRAPLAPTWQSTLPTPASAYDPAPQPRKSFEDMSAAERKTILEII